MQYKKIWEQILSEQSEILEKTLNDEALKKAAIFINNYKEKLLKKNIDINLIADGIISKTHKMIECEDPSDPFFMLERKLDISWKYFDESKGFNIDESFKIFDDLFFKKMKLLEIDEHYFD